MNPWKIKTGFIVFFLLAVCLFTVSCAKQPVIGTFELVVLNESIAQDLPGLGYSKETSDPVIKGAYPSQVIYTITAKDIEKYDWMVFRIQPDNGGFLNGGHYTAADWQTI